MVDLSHPVNDMPAAQDDRANEQDLVGASIEGLEWLVNAPKVDGVDIGKDGIPRNRSSRDARELASPDDPEGSSLSAVELCGYFQGPDTYPDCRGDVGLGVRDKAEGCVG